MAEARTDEAQRLLPLLDYLARVGRRAAEASMAPGGLRPVTSSPSKCSTSKER